MSYELDKIFTKCFCTLSKKYRCMTPRELARLQTFPVKFTFTGSNKDILVQIGNSIPFSLEKYIGKNIKKN